MKTRNLLLWAMVCGVAIMAAGAVLLVQLRNQPEVVEPTPAGTPVRVGDVVATLTDSAMIEGGLTVTVRLDAPPDIDPTTGFRLNTTAGPIAPVVTCEELCTLTFAGQIPEDASLFYRRGEERARWVVG